MHQGQHKIRVAHQIQTTIFKLKDSYICNYSDVHIYIKQNVILTRQRVDATAQARQTDIFFFIFKICDYFLGCINEIK